MTWDTIPVDPTIFIVWDPYVSKPYSGQWDGVVTVWDAGATVWDSGTTTWGDELTIWVE